MIPGIVRRKPGLRVSRTNGLGLFLVSRTNGGGALEPRSDPEGAEPLGNDGGGDGRGEGEDDGGEGRFVGVGAGVLGAGFGGDGSAGKLMVGSGITPGTFTVDTIPGTSGVASAIVAR